jgi:hypothetical protein
VIGKRYIDGDKLLERAFGRLNAPRPIVDWLKRQPRSPKLIGRQKAAEILGVGSPYMTHFIKSGQLKPISVEGGKDAYDEIEVKALAAKRARERREKAKREADAHA